MVLMASALFLLQGPRALAWSNGPGGCNSFGTHDWILESSAFGRSLRAATSALRAGYRR